MKSPPGSNSYHISRREWTDSTPRSSNSREGSRYQTRSHSARGCHHERSRKTTPSKERWRRHPKTPSPIISRSTEAGGGPTEAHQDAADREAYTGTLDRADTTSMIGIRTENWKEPSTYSSTGLAVGRRNLNVYQYQKRKSPLGN